jgi:hypothetical protein
MSSNSIQYTPQLPQVQLPQAQLPQLQQGGDLITHLPSDQIQPSLNEIKIVDTLFKNHTNDMNSIVKESKDCLIIGFLFIILSLPLVDTYLYNFFPSVQNSIYISLVIKAVCFMVTYWLIKHFYLSKKS